MDKDVFHDVQQAISQVMHPEINRSLIELGMVRRVMVNGQKVALTLALPFMGIPAEIRDYMANSLQQAVMGVDSSFQVEISFAEMSPEERTKFFQMEQEGWKGL